MVNSSSLSGSTLVLVCRNYIITLEFLTKSPIGKMFTFFSQVREAMKINSKMNEAAISSDEFTQRMANLEKKLQQVSAERDSLKEENKV